MSEGESNPVTTQSPPPPLTTHRALAFEDFFKGTRLVAVLGGISACAFVLIVLFAIGVSYCKYRPRIRKKTDCEVGLPGDFTEMNTMKSNTNGKRHSITSQDRRKLVADSWNCSPMSVPQDLNDEIQRLGPDADFTTELDEKGNTTGRTLRVSELDPIYQETDHGILNKQSGLAVIDESRPYKPARKKRSVSFKKGPRLKKVPEDDGCLILNRSPRPGGIDNPMFDVHAEDEESPYDNVDDAKLDDLNEYDEDNIYTDPGAIQNEHSILEELNDTLSRFDRKKKVSAKIVALGAEVLPPPPSPKANVAASGEDAEALPPPPLLEIASTDDNASAATQPTAPGQPELPLRKSKKKNSQKLQRRSTKEKSNVFLDELTKKMNDAGT